MRLHFPRRRTALRAFSNGSPPGITASAAPAQDSSFAPLRPVALAGGEILTEGGGTRADRLPTIHDDIFCAHEKR
jgi:hypothetical protein